jgi:beta-lactamase regulating signal transducer with metallopeptidase domain
VETLLLVGLSNAVVATILALAVGAATWVCRRPALLHGLWLLVLLKLITPPLVALPLSWPRTEPVPHEQTLSQEESPAADAPLIDITPITLPPDLLREPTEPSEPTPETSRARTSWPAIVTAVWLSGSALWWLIAGLRLWHFQRLLRFAQPAPVSTQNQAARWATQLGLRRSPPVWLVPAAVSPMLWSFFGRPRLLLPAVLWAKLSAEQRDTLLVHELAHLRRRDHWVRLFELLVLGLYWWHPVVWWARRELREVEEQCCDAWVVWALPASASVYASALVETVAFLSQSRPVLPLMASGAGHVHLLRRRLTMIMRGSTPRTLSTAGLVAVFGLGAILLPLLPRWAQTGPPSEGENPQAVTESVPSQDQPAQSNTLTGFDSAALTRLAQSHQAEQLRDEVELLQVQLEVKRARVQASEMKRAQAQEHLKRLAKLHGQGALGEDRVEEARQEVANLEVQIRIAMTELKEPEVRLQQAQRRLARLEQLKGATSTTTESRDSFVRPSQSAARRQTGSAREGSSEQLLQWKKQLDQVQVQQQAGGEQILYLQKLLAEKEREEQDLKAKMEKLALELQQSRKESDQQRAAAKQILDRMKLQAEEGDRKARVAEDLQRLREAEVAKYRDLRKQYDSGQLSIQDLAPQRQHLEQVEKKLDTLLGELEKLRSELRGRPTPPSRSSSLKGS